MAILNTTKPDTPLLERCAFHNLDPELLPQHIAIIMDGNGRWAKKRHFPRTVGHKQGAESLRRTVKWCDKFDVKFLSVYAFSTENWQRPEKEVSFLMGLFDKLLDKERDELNKQGVKVKFVGDIDGLSESLIKKIRAMEKLTENNQTLQLNIMLNYGSRAEIVSAVKRLAEQAVKGEISPDDINEERISDALYTRGIPDPDILLRPSGEFRISNYLLWQIAYSELVFIETLWPDFSEKEFVEVIRQYQARDRRFGGVK